MKTVGKILAGIVSILLIIILILLTTIKYELLNKTFVFNSFEKHNVYAQLPALIADSLSNDLNLSEEEKIGYGEFVKNIQPQEAKFLIENNLTQVLDFLNGKSKNVTISFSLKGIGFENASAISWSPAQITDKSLQEKIISLNGIGNTLIAVGLIVLVILIGLFFLTGKIILLLSGTFFVVAGLISKLYLMIAGRELMNNSELSQKILGLLFVSVFSDIITALLIMGCSLILLWFALFIAIGIAEKKNEIQKPI